MTSQGNGGAEEEKGKSPFIHFLLPDCVARGSGTDGRGPLGRGEVIEGEFMCHQDELGWPGRYLSIIPQSIKHQSIQGTSKKTLPRFCEYDVKL